MAFNMEGKVMATEKYQTIVWTVVHVFFPLLPFGLGGIIRLITLNEISFTVFDASDLAICLALLSLLINQNLLKNPRNLDNEDKKTETEAQALFFLILAVCFLILFTLITCFDAAVIDLQIEKLKSPLHISESISFFSMLPVLLFSVLTQRSFRLRAELW